MFGPIEIAIVLVIAALVLGASRLPKVARSAGHGMREFNKLKAEVTGADAEPDRKAETSADA